MLLEHLHGTGVVITETGSEVRARYDVRITQDEPPDGAAKPPVAGRKHLGGRIWSDLDPYFVVSHVKKTLELRMEDGRRFKFFHRDLEGNIGLNEWIG